MRLISSKQGRKCQTALIQCLDDTLEYLCE
jgi:hypothetical protein